MTFIRSIFNIKLKREFGHYKVAKLKNKKIIFFTQNRKLRHFTLYIHDQNCSIYKDY